VEEGPHDPRQPHRHGRLRATGDGRPKSTVYDYFARWRDDGTWQRVHDALRDKARAVLGKAPGPRAAIIDSQTAKTTEKGATAASTPTSG
jgi:transposase